MEKLFILLASLCLLCWFNELFLNLTLSLALKRKRDLGNLYSSQLELFVTGFKSVMLCIIIINL